MTHVSKNSGNNEWYTPVQYVESARKVMGSIDVDPASNDIAQATVNAKTYWTKESNGLDKYWSGNVWMNPPYSADLIKLFCSRLVFFTRLGAIRQFVTLTNNATETSWFNEIASVSSAYCFTKGRVKFLNPLGNPAGAPLQGQAFCYFGPNSSGFAEEFSKYGWCSYARA